MPNNRRKHFSLALNPGKCLEVRVPLNYAAADMLAYETYIVSKQDWILRVYEKYRKREEGSPESLREIFPDRDYILFLGEKYPFHIQHHTIPHQTWISLEKNCFEIRTDKNDSEILRAALSNWYFKRAEEILPPLVKAYATAMKLPVPDVVYGSAKTRWQSVTQHEI